MSSSNPPSPPSDANRQKKWVGIGSWIWQHKILSALILFSTMIAFGAGYFSATTVTGVELNASNWSLRSFSFRRDPFTNFQFTSVRHTSVSTYYANWEPNTTETASVVVNPISKHLKNATTTPSRWDIVFISDRYRSEGPAAPLYYLMQARDRNYGSHWDEWSSEFPKKAAILWPAALNLTKLGIYDEIPELMAISREELDEPNFKVRIESYLKRSILDYCRRDEVSAAQKKSAAEVGLKYGDDKALQEYL